jgi:hypothetical protein
MEKLRCWPNGDCYSGEPREQSIIIAGLGEEACLALNGHCEKGVAAAARPSDSTGGGITHGKLSSAVIRPGTPP